MIAVATSTPDHPQPPTAAYVQHNLGASGTAAFDVNAVCSGTVFALSAVGSVILRRGGHALVIGADVYSRILDPADRRTVVLFGATAPARWCWAPASADTPSATSPCTPSANSPASSRSPPAAAASAPRRGRPGRRTALLRDGGPRRAPLRRRGTPQLTKAFLHEVGVEPADIHHVIPHQANGVMLDDVFTHLALPTPACTAP